MDNFDLLLKTNPQQTHVRKHLTTDTMLAIKEIKRIKFAKRFVVGIFVIALLLLLFKWLDNDLFYLMQILLQKFTIVKTQSLLYWSAVFESLPKQQFITVCVIATLLVVWKQIKTTQIFAASLLVVIMALGFSGYSYAQKNEQKKLEILKEFINASGRKELETNLAVNTCASNSNQNLTNQFEIKKNATINSNDAIKIIEAACNINMYETFLRKAHSDASNRRFNTDTRIVSLVTGKYDDKITLKPSFKKDDPEEIYQLTKDTQVYKDKKLVSQSELQKGAIVLPVIRYDYATDQGGDPISTTLVALAILPSDPAFDWYDLTLQHSVTQIAMCPGNPNDRCTFTGSIDFFPSGGGELNRNELYDPQPRNETKEIAGVITEIQDTFVKIKSSSGRTFTVNFGSNPAEEFNRARAQYYDNDKVTVGDTLLVTYDEPANAHSEIINVNRIFTAVIMVEVINKYDPIPQY